MLLGHADERYYVREIVRATGLGSGHVQRELAQLSRAGILRRLEEGRHVYYQADPDCPIYEELRGIVRKTLGAGEVLSTALSKLRRRIDVAFIYGSVARGEERRESDLDLMVVGDVTFAEVARAVRGAEARLRRPVNPTVYPGREFRDKLLSGHHFLSMVTKGPKVFLIGGERELEAVAG